MPRPRGGQVRAPRRPPGTSRLPLGRSLPQRPALPCAPSLRPTSQGFAAQASSAFPGHVAHGPAGSPRAPPGGADSGAARKGENGQRELRRPHVEATPSPAHTARSQTHTHTQLRGNLEGFRLPFIARDTTPSPQSSIPYPRPRPEAASRLAGPACFQAPGQTGARGTGPGPRPPSPVLAREQNPGVAVFSVPGVPAGSGPCTPTSTPKAVPAVHG